MKRDILLYDGDCNLCNGTVRFIKKRDAKNRFQFLSLQTPDAQILLRQFRTDAGLNNTVIYIKDDALFRKSTAVLNLLKELGRPWSFFYLLRFLPLSFRDFFYDWVAKYRYRIFGKKKQQNNAC